MKEITYTEEPGVYEIESVKAAVDNRIATAEVGGLSAFNDTERAEWLDGIEACATLEIALMVYDYLDDFISEGLAVVEEIQSRLGFNALSDDRRRAFFERAQVASFDDKRRLISEIEAAVDEAKALQERTLVILSDQALAVSERAEVIKQLNIEGASAGLMKTAERIVATARDRLHSQQAIQNIESLTHQGKLDAARVVLGKVFGYIPLGEYVRLEQNISRLQIQSSRLLSVQ